MAGTRGGVLFWAFLLSAPTLLLADDAGAGALDILGSALKAEIRAEVDAEVKKLRDEVGKAVHAEVESAVKDAMTHDGEVPKATAATQVTHETEEAPKEIIGVADLTHRAAGVSQVSAQATPKATGQEHGQVEKKHEDSVHTHVTSQDHHQVEKKHHSALAPKHPKAPEHTVAHRQAAHKPALGAHHAQEKREKASSHHGQAEPEKATTTGTHDAAATQQHEGVVLVERRQVLASLRVEKARNRMLKRKIKVAHALLAQLSERVRKARAFHMALKRSSGRIAAGESLDSNDAAQHAAAQHAAAAAKTLATMTAAQERAAQQAALTASAAIHQKLLAAAERVHALEDAQDQAEAEEASAAKALEVSNSRLAEAEAGAKSAEYRAQSMHERGKKMAHQFVALQEKYEAKQKQLNELRVDREEVRRLNEARAQAGREVEKQKQHDQALSQQAQVLALKIASQRKIQKELDRERERLESGIADAAGMANREADLESRLRKAKKVLAARSEEASEAKHQTDLLAAIGSRTAQVKQEEEDAVSLKEKTAELQETLKEKQVELRQALQNAKMEARNRKEKEVHVDRYLAETSSLDKRQEGLAQQLQLNEASQNATVLEIVKLKVTNRKLTETLAREGPATRQVLEQVRSEVVQLRDDVSSSEATQQNLALKVHGEEAVLTEKQKHRLGLLHRGKKPAVPAVVVPPMPEAKPTAAAAPITGFLQPNAPESVQAFLNSPSPVLRPPAKTWRAPLAAKTHQNTATGLLQTRKIPTPAARGAHREYRAENWRKSAVDSLTTMKNFFDSQQKLHQHLKALGSAAAAAAAA